MEAAMQHPIGSYAPRDRLAVGSYREANDTMSAAERVPLLAADSGRIAAALEAETLREVEALEAEAGAAVFGVQHLLEHQEAAILV